MKVPWWTKIGAKIVLSRLPVSYDFWRRVNLFRAGRMDEGEYARKAFDSYLAAYTSIRSLPKGFTFLELGPGDSLLSAVFAKAAGCGKCYLSDSSALATQSVELYQAASQQLLDEGFPAPDLASAKSLEDVLAACNAVYLPNGVEDLRKIPDDSIDICGSIAVLEHVRHGSFDATAEQMFRVSKGTTQHYHVVDFQDHLDHSLNNLRFSHTIWESEFFASSGFYTNRIRPAEMRRKFEKAGFTVRSENESHWIDLPLNRSKMDPYFREMPERELLMRGVTLRLFKSD